jgi:steroid delta-isomerase-like uncharacterized protein
MPDSANATVVRGFFERVCNQRDLKAAEDLFAPEHILHDPSSPGIPNGPRGIQALMGQYQRTFPDARWKIEEIIDAGETVVARWTGSGTQREQLQSIPATGRQVIVPGIWVFRFRDGKIVESWSVWDCLGMLQQLGAMPKVALTRSAQ